MDLKNAIVDARLYDDGGPSQEWTYRKSAAFAPWLLKCEALRKARECPLNVCLLFALNNMAGCVLYETLYDFCKFLAKWRNLTADAILLEFIIEKGIKIATDRPYLYVYDDVERKMRIATLKKDYAMNVHEIVSCAFSTIALTHMLDEHMGARRGIIRFDKHPASGQVSTHMIAVRQYFARDSFW